MELSPLSKVIQDWGAPTLQNLDTDRAVPGERIRGSNRQYVRFYLKKFIDVIASKVKVIEKTGEVKVLASEAKEVEREMVQIITPGDKNEIDTIAQDFHRREHWQAYKAFRDGNGVILGKKLEECTYVPPSVTLELKYRGCHTEEQLADASDLLCNQIGNGWSYREFARAAQKIELENKSLGQVTALKSELAKTQESLKALQKKLGVTEDVEPSIESGMPEGYVGVSFDDDIDSSAPIPKPLKRSPGRPRKNVLPTEI